MSWDMGYYGGSDGYGADDDGYDVEEPPQQQQRPQAKSPGLRSHIRAITAKNKELEAKVKEYEQALSELMEGDTSPQVHNAPPTSRLTDAEQMQYERMAAMGAVGVAPPAGTEAEQIARIRNARTPQELSDYLRSQGSAIGMNYEGLGY